MFGGRLEVGTIVDGGTSDSMCDAPLCVSDLIACLEREGKAGRAVSLETLQRMSGPRFTGPLILLPGLAIVSPLSGIPTLPTVVGAAVSIMCLQIVIGRDHIWMPRRLRRLALGPKNVLRVIRILRRPAKVLDRLCAPRITWMTDGLPMRMAALACFLLGLLMPALEFLPLTSSLAGAVIAAFGLALTTHDGLLMMCLFAVFTSIVFGSAAMFVA
jgi:hypothetical protein